MRLTRYPAPEYEQTIRSREARHERASIDAGQGESTGIAAGASRWRPKQLSKEAFGLLGSEAHPFVADLRR